MIQAARRRCSINLRIVMSDRSGNSCEYRSLSSSATAFMEHTSAVQRPRAWSPPSSTNSAMLSACGRHYSPCPSSQASTMVNRRTMSTTKGKPTAGTVPGMIKGFGLRQKAPDPGNSALGKGFDIMEDDVGSRKKVVIAGYDPHGFQLGDGVDVRGSMICFPNSFVLWRPKRAKDITVESLHLLDLVMPKIDIVVVGVGERMTERLDPALMKHLRSKRISVELMDTVNACSTFNVLNAEDRRVAAALLQLSETEEEA